MTEKRGQRKFTSAEKVQILEEAKQPGVTIAAVCRKHAIAPTQFYRWRAVADQAAVTALKSEGRGRLGKNGEEDKGRLEAEIQRLRAVISEITAENLELKKKDLRLGDLARTPAEVKQEVLAWVDKTRRRSGWVLKRILAGLGVPKSVYYDWLKRRSADRLADEKPKPPRLNQVLAEEREAIIAFAPEVSEDRLSQACLDDARSENRRGGREHGVSRIEWRWPSVALEAKRVFSGRISLPADSTERTVAYRRSLHLGGRLLVFPVELHRRLQPLHRASSIALGDQWPDRFYRVGGSAGESGRRQTARRA